MNNWWVDAEGSHRSDIHENGKICNGAAEGRNSSTVNFHALLHRRIHRLPAAIPTPQHSHQALTPITPPNQLHPISNHDLLNHPILTSELALVKLKTYTVDKWAVGKVVAEGLNKGKYSNDLTMCHIFHLPQHHGRCHTVDGKLGHVDSSIMEALLALGSP